MAQAQVIIHPSFAKAQNRRNANFVPKKNKTNLPHIAHMTTREIKRSIQMLSLIVSLPADNPLACQDDKALFKVEKRLNDYHRELFIRDKRDEERLQNVNAPPMRKQM